MIRGKLLIAAMLVCGSAFGQTFGTRESPDCGKPFKIVGNLYYVGTFDLAC
jgi:hypothetical protein